MARAAAKSIDAYIAVARPEVRATLRKIRKTVASAAPGAEECMGYGMPSFKLNGALVYFAAFKEHVGFFPPVRGSESLTRASAKYAGPKGNLKFPLKGRMPYGLITRLVKTRVKQNLERRKRK
jgi:uncharacterized protein YdhG (YjbR/CyaY superfamily)